MFEADAMHVEVVRAAAVSTPAARRTKTDELRQLAGTTPLKEEDVKD